METEISLKGWALKLFSVGVAMIVCTMAWLGAVYVFLPSLLAESDHWKLLSITMTCAATFIGIPVMGKWVNDRLLRVFSKLLRT
jgi:hypothetical protein